MQFSRAAQGYLDELAAKPAARQEATLGEIWRANWNGAAYETLTGSGNAAMAAVREYKTAAERVLGQKISIDEDFDRGAEVSQPEYYAKRIKDAIDASTIDDESKKQLEKLHDVRRIAADRAQKTLRETEDVNQNAYGISGWATAWLANTARQFVDPVNLATAPLGGPLKGPLLKMAVREFGIGAGVQALQEPSIQANRGALGLESGAGQAVSNILQAGAGNLAFGLAGRGLTSIYWKAAENAAFLPRPSRWEGFSFTGGIKYRPEALEAAGGLRSAPDGASLTPEDFAAAARHAERDLALDAAVPSQQLRAELPVRIDRAAEALESGRSLDGIGQPFESPELYGPPTPAPRFAEGFNPQRVAYVDGDVQQLIRPDGSRLATRPVVLELSDLIVSHNIDGVPNANYPRALQPRDRAAPASRSWVAETAPKLEPELLGRALVAGQGAPVIGPDGVIESGNGRAMLIARAYDRHPGRAEAYRDWLSAQGYDVTEFQFPVLVRMREGEIKDRAAFAKEANVSAVANLSVREQAKADAARLDSALLGGFKGGNIADLQNAGFVRAFADRAVAPEERPQFIGGDDRISVAGAARVEAAMVARGWADERLITGLYETTDPNTRAILGAFADTAPVAARLRAAIEEGRVEAASDPAPALIEAWQLVDRARANNVRVLDAVNQLDLERGTVSDEVRAAVQLYFRDDALRLPAGREIVAARIEKALNRAIDTQNALGDLFGDAPSVQASLAAAKLEGVDRGDMRFDFKGMTGSVDATRMTERAYREAWRTLTEGQPFDTVEQGIERAAVHQPRLVSALAAAAQPPVPAGHKRFYHGGHRADVEIKNLDDLWVAPQLEYAANFRRDSGSRNKVWFVDIPEAEAKLLPGAFDEINGYWRNVNLPKDWARRARPLDGGSASVKDPGAKVDLDRIALKMREKAYPSPKRLTDLARAGVIVAQPEDADALARQLAQQFRVVDEGWKKNVVGYFDRKLAVVFEDGTVGEVQIWPREILEAKSKGHDLYNARVAETDPAKRAEIMKEETAYWAEVSARLGDAWAPLIGGKPNSPISSPNASLASSSEIARGASLSRTASSTGDQPLPGLSTKASDPALTASRPSQLKNEAPASIDQKVGPEGGENKPKVPGDAQLRADAERALTEAGGDFLIETPDGSVRSARELLTEAENDAKAAAELKDCMGGGE